MLLVCRMHADLHSPGKPFTHVTHSFMSAALTTCFQYIMINEDLTTNDTAPIQLRCELSCTT